MTLNHSTIDNIQWSNPSRLEGPAFEFGQPQRMGSHPVLIMTGKSFRALVKTVNDNHFTLDFCQSFSAETLGVHFIGCEEE